jgi:hypothetical protein
MLKSLRLIHFLKSLRDLKSAVAHKRRHLGGWGIDLPTFIPALSVLLFLGGLCRCEQKNNFRLAALAIIIPPTCESGSAPLLSHRAFCIPRHYDALSEEVKACVDSAVVGLQFVWMAACIISVTLKREKVTCGNTGQSKRNLMLHLFTKHVLLIRINDQSRLNQAWEISSYFVCFVFFNVHHSNGALFFCACTLCSQLLTENGHRSTTWRGGRNLQVKVTCIRFFCYQR